MDWIVRPSSSKEHTSPQVGQAAESGVSAVNSRAAHSWIRQLHKPANRRAPSSILLKWRGVFRSHPAKTVCTARSVASSKTCSNFFRTCSEMPSMATPPNIRTDSYPTTIGYLNRKPSRSPIDVVRSRPGGTEAGLHPIAGSPENRHCMPDRIYVHLTIPSNWAAPPRAHPKQGACL